MNYGNYIDFSSLKKILVLKLRHHGDVLLSSPVFSVLKNHYPHIEIHACIYKETLPMLEGHPAIEAFHVYDRNWKRGSFLKRIQKEIQLYYQIRKKGYDAVINLTEGDRGALIALVSGAKIRVGLDAEGKGFLGKNATYTHVVKRPKLPRHTVEKDLDALRKMGLFPNEEERSLFLHVPLEVKVEVDKKLEEEGIDPKKPFLLVHPTSRWRFKCPPMKWFAQLILKLEDMPVVITSSPADEEMALIEELKQHLGSKKVAFLTGKTTLKELAALIGKASKLLTVDSVPLHIASALKTPTVVVFGPSCEINWGPWLNARASVIRGNYSCRPCHMDGCGGSKVSDCLQHLKQELVLQELQKL